MSVDAVIHSARLIDAGEIVDHAWFAFTGGRVTATGTGADWRQLAPRDATDAAGGWLTPGFIDLHVHGGGGATHDDGAEAIATARAAHRRHGTTRSVISLVTASVDDLAARTAMIADVAEADPTVLGSHLEGPFLVPERKGAHTESLLRAPDAAAVDRLLEAGRGTVRQITLAPEREGALDAIRRLRAAGAIAAVGHTSADAEITRRAFDAGATLLTHTFNAMPGIHHREPGPIPVAIADERVTLELIADGVHVHPDVMRMLFAAAPDRVVLVTDAMGAAGSADGAYELGGLAVTVTDGVARLTEGGAIAGSTLTQDAALRTMVHRCAIPLPAAVAALTRIPARVLGTSEIGTLHPGAHADAVLLDADLRVQRVWVAGDPV